MNDFEAKLARYLQEILGAEAQLVPWETSPKLPYFLRDAYILRCCQVAGHSIMLAIERRKQRPVARDLRAQLARVAAIAELPAAYVVTALSSHERKRLIAQKIPFIVPGNQLFLPMLGMDLREYFRQTLQSEERAISPATQAILIAALMRRLWPTEWAPASVSAGLGYGPMTLSRAVRELTAAGLALLVPVARKHFLRFDRPPADVWKAATPLLQSPVRKSVWVNVDSPRFRELKALPAGQSALAQSTMLAEPKWPAYAVGASHWKHAQANQRVLPEPDDGSAELQIWSYTPWLCSPEQTTVDPLSLTLSLQDVKDERVQLSLDALKAYFPWSKA